MQHVTTDCETEEAAIRSFCRVKASAGDTKTSFQVSTCQMRDPGSPSKDNRQEFTRIAATKLGVIPTPELVYHKVVEDDEYLVLATDGVWEFLEAEDVLAVVDRHYLAGQSAYEAAKYIIAKSARQWQVHEGDYRDDITVIVVYLQPLLQNLRRERKHASPAGSPRPLHSSVLSDASLQPSTSPEGLRPPQPQEGRRLSEGMR